MPTWTFITNHGAVLSLVASNPRITAREIASRLGITEWSVFRVISDLEAGGYLTRYKEGRTNFYEVDHNLPLRRPDVRDVAVGEMLKLLMDPDGEAERAGGPPEETSNEAAARLR